MEARIAGEPDLRAVSKELSVVEGRLYRWLLTIKMPESLDEEDLQEDIDLFVTVESRKEGQASSFGVDLTLQRESNKIEILDVDMDNEINAGDVLSLDVVIKNRGRQTSEDTFVVARIPALKVEDRAYFGDLTPMDQDDPDKEDSNERRLSLRIPSNAPAGVYVVEIEASNDDSVDTITKKVVVTGAQMKTQVVAPVHTRSFEAGDTGQYTLVLVNSGNQVGVFELVVESPAGVTVEVSDPVVAVPAGSSKTVTLDVKAEEAGTYNFAVNVHSGGELVTREEFTAKVEGTNGGSITRTSPTVLLTVVLAVIFVVLLIVLIVLLTRRPEKSEEFGESYY
ncbi:MAG: hypothetical protein Q7S27_05675 [Nanoarchaeota archaeon]|nr:hypothetical protein [Nanoarchaeota archaeon]